MIDLPSYAAYLNAAQAYERAIKAFYELNYETQFLTPGDALDRGYPKELRVISGSLIVYEVEPRQSALHFTTGRDSEDSKTIALSLPYLYLICDKNPQYLLHNTDPYASLSRVFCRPNMLSDTGNTLYHLPLSHISESGGICVGDGGGYEHPHTDYHHIFNSAYRDFLFTRFYNHLRPEVRLHRFPNLSQWAKESQGFATYGLCLRYAPGPTMDMLLLENQHYNSSVVKNFEERLSQYKEVIDTYAYKFKDELARIHREETLERTPDSPEAPSET